MEKRWLALAQSYDFTRRLTDFVAQMRTGGEGFDERVRTGQTPDDARRLQKMIQEIEVDAHFERMWLASIVEHSDDAIISKNLHGIITTWNKDAKRLFGYLAEEVIGKRVTT